MSFDSSVKSIRMVSLVTLRNRVNDWNDRHILKETDIERSSNCINISPAYQRNSAWSKKFKEDFIASLILGFPFQGIILNVNENKEFEVFDGKQRLLTTIAFLNNEIKTPKRMSKKGILLPEGCREVYFKDLSDDIKREIARREICVQIMELNKEEISILYSIFNSNVSKLTVSELRRGELSEAKCYKQITKYVTDDFSKSIFAKKNDQRFYNEHLVCKVLAIYKDPLMHEKQYTKTVNHFLSEDKNFDETNKFIEKLQEILKIKELNIIKNSNDGKKCVILGNLVLLSMNDIKYFKKEISDLINKFINMNPDDFEPGLSLNNNSNLYQKCITKFFNDQLTKIISLPKEKRIFDKELRIYFANKGLKCEICESSLNEDNINLDHRIPWSKGGKTEISNLGILCDDCNKKKSNKTLDDLAG